MGFIEMALTQIGEHLSATHASLAAIQQPPPLDEGRLVRSVDSAAYDALLADVQRTLTDTQVLIDEVRHLKAMVPPYPAIPNGQVLSAAQTADLSYQQRARSK